MINKTTMTLAAALALAAGCGNAVSDPTDFECDPAVELCDDPGDGDGDGDADGDAGPGDPLAPTISVIPTEILDERADLVSFDAQGAPIDFTHTGDASVLGDTECGAVFKHAFLLDPSTEATESPANPLRFTFFIAADPRFEPASVTGDYRVRRMGEPEFLTDWIAAARAATGDGGATFVADLDLEAVPELAFEEGLFEIELRGVDPEGREVTAIRCFDHQPLGGPIRVGAAAKLTVGPKTLAGLRLDSNDPISPLLNGDGAAGVMLFTLTNATSRDTYAELTLQPVKGTCTKRWKQLNVLTKIAGAQINCADNPRGCDPPVLGTVIDKTEACDPAIRRIPDELEVRVERSGVGVSPCAECEGTRYLLPANSTTTVFVNAVDLPGLQPRSAGEPEKATSEISLSFRTSSLGLGSCPGSPDCATIDFTGHTTTRTGCSNKTLVPTTGEIFCTERKTHKIVRAMRTISVNLEQVSVNVDVSASGGGIAFPPTDQEPSPTVSAYGWSTNEPTLP